MKALLAALLVFGTPGIDQDDKSAPPAPGLATSLPEPAYLPQAARAVLRERMRRHGPDSRDLLTTLTLLYHDRAAELAGRIESEPLLAEPGKAGPDTLNAALPARFFVLQKQLQQRAGDVARAARAKDNGKMATAFGKVVEVCVACHAVYVKGGK